VSGNPLADDVWRDLTSLVHHNRDSWKRTAIDRTGLPFSRIRVLSRLRSEPLTVKELAYAATMDAPAATVAVNDLEERGLVVREISPENRRCKRVSLTAAGRAALETLDAIDDPAPQQLAALADDDLRAMRSILAKLNASVPAK
jgi:DNA-binding MarR family transcriptional regulator